MDAVTEVRLMVLSGWVLLYGLVFGVTVGIKALRKRRKRRT